MNILVISNSLPYPPDTGEKIRVYNLLKHLAVDNEISLICFAKDEDMQHARVLQELVSEVIIIPFKKKSKLVLAMTILNGLFRGQPITCAIYESHNMRVSILRHLRKNQFDLVAIEHSYMGIYVDMIQEIAPHVQCILTAHNIMYDYMLRAIPLLKGFKKKLFARLDLLLLRKWERRLFSRCDAVVLMSQRDKRWVEDKHWGGNYIVAPNGVSTDEISVLPESSNPYNLLFVGRMSYLPNHDAVSYFINDIFPSIKEMYPESIFTVVGGDLPSPWVESLDNIDRVVFAGKVDNLKEYYLKAGIVVVPLRAGGGTRLKILESMAYGRPVVSTSVGCEGLEVSHGKDILIAETPYEFIAAIDKIITDNAFRQNMIKEARYLVTKKYSWLNISGAYEKALYDLFSIDQA